MVKDDIGRKGKVSDDQQRLKIPFRIGKRPRYVLIQSLKIPLGSSQQEAYKQSRRDRSDLFGAAHDARPALFAAVTHQPAACPGLARERNDQ